MKTRRFFPPIFALALLAVSCSDSGSPSDPLEMDPGEEPELRTSQAINHPDVVAQRANYQIVVQDADGWEIMLNLVKKRRISWTTDSLYSYEGHMIYKLGPKTIIGSATALLDRRTGGLIVAAVDSAYNRGLIAYSFQVPATAPAGDWNMPVGTYHYKKVPVRMNAIRGRLIKGTLGDLSIPASSGLGISVPASPPTQEEVEAMEAYVPRKHFEWEPDPAARRRRDGT